MMKCPMCGSVLPPGAASFVLRLPQTPMKAAAALLDLFGRGYDEGFEAGHAEGFAEGVADGLVLGALAEAENKK